MQRFLVDLMLMRLGRWLRLLGQDVARPEGESDAELLLQAKKESRTIITRDKGLFQACPGAGVQCMLIRSSAISDQLLEMADAGVPLRLDPQRCTLCNGLLEEKEMHRDEEVAVPGLQEALLGRRPLAEDGKDAASYSLPKRGKCRADWRRKGN